MIIHTMTTRRRYDDDPDTSYLEQEGFEDRLGEYQNDLFGFIGIDATAEIDVNGTIQTISSGGLWGIESDALPEHLKEYETEQLDLLCEILEAMGFGLEEIIEARTAA